MATVLQGKTFGKIGLPKLDFGNVSTRVQLAYGSLNLGSWVMFIIAFVMIGAMCLGGYKEGERQGFKLVLGITYDDVDEIIQMVNQYALPLLIGVCWFTSRKNASKEVARDILTILAGVVIPQLAFHASLVLIANGLLTRLDSVSSSVVAAFNSEWVIVLLLTAVCVGIAFAWWYFVRGGCSEQEKKAIVKK